jgi:Poxvirus A32 protein
MKLDLPKFDLNRIAPFSTIVLIGKRNTGKSVLVTDIVHRFKDMSAIVVMSGTEAGNRHFQQYVPDSFVYNDYNPDAIAGIIKRQTALIDKGMSRESIGILVVLDDCSYDKNALNRDKNLRFMFMNGRHLGITTILTTQYAMDISSGLRYNIDYVFAFKDNTFTNKERLYKNFFGVFNKAKEFYTVFDQIAVGYDCIVLDNTSRSNKISDQIAWFRATMRPPGSFIFGTKELWRAHERMYRHKRPRPEETNDNQPDYEIEHAKCDGLTVNKKDHIRSTVF